MRDNPVLKKKQEANTNKKNLSCILLAFANIGNFVFKMKEKTSLTHSNFRQSENSSGFNAYVLMVVKFQSQHCRDPVGSAHE